MEKVLPIEIKESWIYRMQKWNVYVALTHDNNSWQLTSLVEVHSEVSGTSAACQGRTPWREVRMRLTSDLVLIFEHKHRPKTEKNTESQFRSFTGVEISQNPSQWVLHDWGTLTFLRHPFRWLERGGRVERTAGHHSAGTASQFAATGTGRDEDDEEERWAQMRRIKWWCCH